MSAINHLPKKKKSLEFIFIDKIFPGQKKRSGKHKFTINTKMSRFDSNNNNCAELYNITDWKNDSIDIYSQTGPIFSYLLSYELKSILFWSIPSYDIWVKNICVKTLTSTKAKFKHFFPDDSVLLLLKSYKEGSGSKLMLSCHISTENNKWHATRGGERASHQLSKKEKEKSSSSCYFLVISITRKKT